MEYLLYYVEMDATSLDKLNILDLMDKDTQILPFARMNVKKNVLSLEKINGFENFYLSLH